MLRTSGILYRRNFTGLFVVFLPLAVAFLIVLVPLLALPDQTIRPGGGTPTAVLFALGFALMVIPLLVGAIVVAAGSLMLTDTIVGKGTSAVRAYGQMRAHLGPVVAAGLAATLLSVILRVLLPPFEFILRPLLYGPAIVGQVIALEGTDLKGSLSRAGQLLRKETLRIFMYLFAISLGASLLAVLVPGFATIGLGDANDVVYFTITSLLQILVVAIIFPFVAVAMLVAYFDLRARKENLSFGELVAERAGSG
jgi:hypothetical protein